MKKVICLLIIGACILMGSSVYAQEDGRKKSLESGTIEDYEISAMRNISDQPLAERELSRIEDIQLLSQEAKEREERAVATVEENISARDEEIRISPETDSVLSNEEIRILPEAVELDQIPYCPSGP